MVSTAMYMILRIIWWIFLKTAPPNTRTIQLIGEKDSAGVYQWVTYSQIATRVNNLRAGLSAIGVKAGDTVGIIANNRKEWLIGEIATQGLGAAYVPMYEKELVSMWKYIIKDAADQGSVCIQT